MFEELSGTKVYQCKVLYVKDSVQIESIEAKPFLEISYVFALRELSKKCKVIVKNYRELLKITELQWLMYLPLIS